MVPDKLPLIARSSLEEMLESIRRRDKHPKDAPPSLPSRPVSKGRLPSARKSLPLNFKVGNKLNTSEEQVCSVGSSTKEKVNKGKNLETKEATSRSGCFGKNRNKIEHPDESPYDMFPKLHSFKEISQEDDQGHDRELFRSSFSSPTGASTEFRWGDTAEYTLKNKLHVWCNLPNEKWELGKIESVSGEDAHVLFSDGKALNVSAKNILPANPDILDGVDDLTQLSYLNEPSILYNLQNRHSHNAIYTKAGPVLLAVNPFKNVPLYGHEVIHDHQHKLKNSPHVYAITDNAFRKMMRDEVNQSIIISGESGAGKTETAKYAMQYLDTFSRVNGVGFDILKINSILEAFGNAKTSRNNNSSRFGKLIEINFDKAGKTCGSNIETFFLEKSRVVQRRKGERSYHIFYQLCAGASPHLREYLNLKMARDYEYLIQSNCLMIDGVDDANSFSMLMEALDNIQICKEDQKNVFSMIVAVLWLGNISFSSVNDENNVQVTVDEGVISAAKLLGCTVKELVSALSTRKTNTGEESTVQKLTLSQVIDTRDALAKFIYSSLFDWLVEQINMFLGVGNKYTWKSISILDIYGFESFHKNSFEQFCINYANERLHQHFIRHLFKLKQEEYAQDGVDWIKLEFVDNIECLNLFEKRPIGLLSLLNGESAFPEATDMSFFKIMKHHLNSHSCFKEYTDGDFGVLHCAGEVWYETIGFLEKNRDPPHCDFIQLLLSSSNEFPKVFAKNIDNKSEKYLNFMRPSSYVDFQKQSVITKFKDKLFNLMHKMDNTSPHFICCIKPNESQFAGVYENKFVLRQLRYYGFLEVIRSSRYGYPTQMTHQYFSRRYSFLLSETITYQDPLSISVAILQQFNIPAGMYQVGYTKLFFREGQISVFEDARMQTLQGNVACFHQKKIEAIVLQSFVDGEMSTNEFELLSERYKAVVIIQKHIKRRISQTMLTVLRRASVCIQSVIRGWIARKRIFFKLRSKLKLLSMRYRAVITIQKYAKRQICQRFFNNQRIAVVCMQSVIRGCIARQQVRSIRNWETTKFKLVKHKLLKRKNILPSGLPESMDLVSNMENSQILPSVLEELQRRVVLAESALRKSEEEKSDMQQKIQIYETRWSEYETKMTSMEETWQKQMTALQISLASARKSLASDDCMIRKNEKYEFSTSNNNKKEAMSAEITNPADGIGMGRDSKVSNNAVNHVAREYEQRKRCFEDDIQCLIQYSYVNANPDEELQKLRNQFKLWKREYKVRLRETKSTIHKNAITEAEKSKKNWWGKKVTK